MAAVSANGAESRHVLIFHFALSSRLPPSPCVAKCMDRANHLSLCYLQCNEVRPQCSNCVKHDIVCDFLSNPPKPADPASRPQSHRRSESKLTSQSPAQPSPAAQNDSLEKSGKYLPDLQMDELELLHHFTTETCFTLSDRAESHRIWQTTVPQEAFGRAFLMRGILAISALHLSHLRPHMQKHYTNIAAQQQDAALSGFRAIMTKMDQTNCDAFFALSSLIVVYGFESPKASDSLGMFSYNGDDLDEWLPLIRGVNSVIMSVWPWIKDGRLSRLLHDHKEEPAATSLPPVLEEQLLNLERTCGNASGDDDAIAACKTALNQLRDCFVRLNNKLPSECEVSLAFMWPVQLPQYFLDMLNDKRPAALIILAHYCVILHHLDDYVSPRPRIAEALLTFVTVVDERLGSPH